ncbi:DUF6333 family protein [Streptomyces luteolus]|uniref:DUF6333 family protein n=1 Tax=Streptomyces luteolus TaxID=3043615 RepID=A0ABT6SQ55_9ACTN|nr:DUF6333 family protein [Streptomyces sp. B-S-A12]MDI3417741.1 DUF6333 family protein [Streptomyces sp. B-S-A12]
MDAYLAGMEAQEGSPAHTLYLWIETLHERMDLLVDQFTGEGWEHDYSIDSLRLLEEDLASIYGTDDGTHAQALYMECLAGYLGEALLEEGGGRWVWDEEAGAVGMPAVQPDPVLGLEPIVPILLVGQAVYEKTENIFATVALRLRKAVVEHKKANPGWKPDRVPTPWVRFHELEAFGHYWKQWPSERFHDYLGWWAEKAGGGRERWDFSPASLDALEELLRDRLGTVEEYDRVAERSFWIVAAWYVGEYVVRNKDAGWQFRKTNPEAPPGTWYAEDSYWTDSIYVAQPMRYAGWAEHPAEMIRAVLRGEPLRDVVDKFPDPGEEHRRDGRPKSAGEPWPEILWPLVAPEHLPPPLTDEQRRQLADELRELEADPELDDPDWHDNPRLHAYLAERREAFPDWAELAGGGVEAWDFSPESLDRLGALVRERFPTYEEITAAQHEPFVQGAGWYLGEVQVIHRDARWSLRPEPDEDNPYDEPTVLERPRDEDDFEYEDGDDYDEDAVDPDDPDDPDDDQGYLCQPVGHLRGLIARDDPDERLSEVLDGYRKRGSGTAGTEGDGRKPTDEVRPKWGSGATLTLLFPPFPEQEQEQDTGAESADDRGDVGVTPHDPVRARQFVEALGTVAEVVEELPCVPAVDVPMPEVRADLDRVAVGCWGNVVHIVEPALGSDLLTEALYAEIRRQRARHPEARIVGSVEMDYGNSYLEDAVLLPGGEEVIAGGWDCDEDWNITGDPEALLRAIGVDRESAAEAGFDLDDEPSERDWPMLGGARPGRRTRRLAGRAADLGVPCPAHGQRGISPGGGVVPQLRPGRV